LVDEEDREYALDPEGSRVLVTPEFSGSRYPWVLLEATRDQCKLSSVPGTETPDRIRDLAVGIFGRLPHTPVESVAVTYHRHFDVPREHWEELAARLAPVEPLSGLVDGAKLESIEYEVDRESGELSILVEPSHLEGFTTFVLVEDEQEIPPGGDSAGRAVQALEERWDAIRDSAENIMNGLVAVG
jgi:hypothetical protein